MIDNGNDFLDLSEEIEESQDEEVFRIIPKDLHIPELEEEVALYLSRAFQFPKNDKKYKPVTILQTKDPDEFKRWVLEQRRRCLEGYDGMSGKMYFYFNFCKIVSLRGAITPEYRVVDAEWFKLVDACQKSRKWGIVCVKRRRVGASWKEAADALHDAIFKKNFHVGMNSKTDRDSQLLFSKVKYLYDNLPDFFRVRTLSSTNSYLEFARWDKSVTPRRKVGNRSDVMAVAPTDTAFEGQLLNKWICDEAGKISNLEQLYAYTEPCLYQETLRAGMPIIFGTSGDVGNEGKELKKMWQHAAVYKFKRFFFTGYMGLYTDEYGNDNVEDCIRWIIYTRHEKAKLGNKALSDFIQQYPLTINEAFNQASAGGIGDIIRINKQKASLMINPPKQVSGRFRRNSEGVVEWVPDRRGSAILYEHPKDDTKNSYVAGCDPADHDDAYDEASDLSLYILSKAQGLEPPRIVLEYTDRPKNVDDFYEQALMALEYYNDTKVLIERNRYGMIKYFDTMGKKYLLQRTPTSVTRMFGGRAQTMGLQMTPAVKEYLKELIALYVKDYCEFIQSEELLDEFISFGSRNTDKAMAFGIALILLREVERIEPSSISKTKSKLPTFMYIKQDGRIKRVNIKT